MGDIASSASFYRLCFRPPVAGPRPCGCAPGGGPGFAAAGLERGRLPAFVIRPLALRAADLIGSLLVAAAITAAMCVVMLLIAAYRSMPLQIEQCAGFTW